MLSLLVAAAAISFFIRRYYQWLTFNSIKYIRGPPTSSFLTGHLREVALQESVGDLDFKWMKEYGTAWRLKGPLGSDVLVLADAKGLQHVLQKSGYNYPKTIQDLAILYCLAYKSIIWAPIEEMHTRHRKVMIPAFSVPQLRSFLPLFRRSFYKMSQLWKDQLCSHQSHDAPVTLNVDAWLARATLDIIGEAAFDYDMGALDEGENEVSKAYHNMFADSQLYPSTFSVIFQALWSFIPHRIVYLARYLPTREYARFRYTLQVISEVSKRLIREKGRNLVASDTSAKDVMSVLVRANHSENPRTRLDGEEMASQMAAFMLAGHETTSHSITWMLYELARHPEIQDKLRAEIAEKREEIIQRGDLDFTMDDLENMPYVQAIVKETLRYHPIVYQIYRVAGKDDVIPLAEPILTQSGELISGIPVAKGQVITASLCSYNRLTSIWGKDAHEWNPMRFIGSSAEKQVKVGMYANLMSFSAGVRSCIGWRFAVIEKQAALVELVEKFRFSLPTEKLEILRAPTMAVAPLVKGKEHEGFQMPLQLTPV